MRPRLRTLLTLTLTAFFAVGGLLGSGVTTPTSEQMGANLLQGVAPTYPSNLWLALETSPVANDGTGGTEVSDPNYARLSLTRNPTNWVKTGAATWQNGTYLRFASSATSYTVYQAALLDAATGGNVKATFDLANPLTVPIGKFLAFPPNAVTLRMVPSTPTNNPAFFTLAWDASPGPGVTGYKVHFGTQSGVYGTTIDVGNALSATVGNLTRGTLYYFVVGAYNSGGTESPYSNEANGSAP